MKKIYIIITALLLCTAMIFALCSCGDGAADETTDKAAETTDKAAETSDNTAENATGAVTDDKTTETDAETADAAITDQASETDGADTSAVSDGNTSHTHSYTAQVITEPGCESKGLTRYTCSCGDSYDKETDAKGHDFAMFEKVEPTYVTGGYTVYKCSRCGEVEIRDTVPPISGGIELPDVEIGD